MNQSVEELTPKGSRTRLREFESTLHQTSQEASSRLARDSLKPIVDTPFNIMVQNIPQHEEEVVSSPARQRKQVDHSNVYKELRHKGLDFDKIIEASRVFPKPQLLTNKSKVTTKETTSMWTGPEMQFANQNSIKNVISYEKRQQVINHNQHHQAAFDKGIK